MTSNNVHDHDCGCADFRDRRVCANGGGRAHVHEHAVADRMHEFLANHEYDQTHQPIQKDEMDLEWTQRKAEGEKMASNEKADDGHADDAVSLFAQV